MCRSLCKGLPFICFIQPCIEAAAHSVYYHVDLDTNFEDRTGFICGVARYNEEATVHAELVSEHVSNDVSEFPSPLLAKSLTP